MLTTGSANLHSVTAIQHGTAIQSGEHHREIEVVEDSTGIVTIYIRELHPGLDPVSVRFVGYDGRES